jgi:hypothetical protein
VFGWIPKVVGVDKRDRRWISALRFSISVRCEINPIGIPIGFDTFRGKRKGKWSARCEWGKIQGVGQEAAVERLAAFSFFAGFAPVSV